MIEPIVIDGTPKTPTINFKTGKIEISGRSIPENSVEFYKPMLEWLTEYIEKPDEKTEINIMLEYFNTSSSKCLLDIFKKFETLHRTHKIVINWCYEEDDEDMLEAGEDYESIIKVPFNMVEVEEY